MAVQLLDGKKVTALIATVREHGEKYEQLVHTAGVQCLAHLAEHGDKTLLANLLGCDFYNKDNIEVSGPATGAVQESMQRSVIIWLQAYSPLRFTVRGNRWSYKINKAALDKAKADGVSPYDLDGANDNPFWSLQLVREDNTRPVGMDNLQNVIHGVLKRFENALVAGKFEGDPVAMRQYIDAVMAVKMPDAHEDRLIKADFQERTEVEAVILQFDKRSDEPKPQAAGGGSRARQRAA